MTNGVYKIYQKSQLNQKCIYDFVTPNTFNYRHFRYHHTICLLQSNFPSYRRSDHLEFEKTVFGIPYLRCDPGIKLEYSTVLVLARVYKIFGHDRRQPSVTQKQFSETFLLLLFPSAIFVCHHNCSPLVLFIVFFFFVFIILRVSWLVWVTKREKWSFPCLFRWTVNGGQTG